MSGGSFAYAGSRARWQADTLLEMLDERIAQHRASELPEDARTAFRGLFEDVRRTVADRVMHDIEWFFSDDIGADSLKKAISEDWPSLDLPPDALSRPVPPARFLSEYDLARGLLEFADLLREKLDEDAPIFIGGSRDDIPVDIRAQLEKVIPYIECVAHAAVLAEQAVYGDIEASEFTGSAGRWPISMVRGNLDFPAALGR